MWRVENGCLKVDTVVPLRICLACPSCHQNLACHGHDEHLKKETVYIYILYIQNKYIAIIDYDIDLVTVIP